VQNGSLAVSGGRDLVPLVNELLNSSYFDTKVTTQDWHPANHVSFASNHPPPNNKPFESFIDLRNLVGKKPEETMKQNLWPVHCQADSDGAKLVEGLQLDKVDISIRKGMDHRVEMYSAFADSFGNLAASEGGVTEDLADSLKSRGVTDVFVVGLAGDYCVKYTAMDAVKAGFSATLLEDVQRCVDPSSWEGVKKELKAAKVQVGSMADLPI
jgi:nicotinamidase-related amidase